MNHPWNRIGAGLFAAISLLGFSSLSAADFKVATSDSASSKGRVTLKQHDYIHIVLRPRADADGMKPSSSASPWARAIA